MAKLQSEFTVECPCCGATLTVDPHLGRVTQHQAPERADKPNLDHAQRILAEEKARRESLFEQSVQAERFLCDAPEGALGTGRWVLGRPLDDLAVGWLRRYRRKKNIKKR